MDFVGGGGNIAIATALHPSFFVYCILNIRQFVGFIYPFSHACLRLRFLDVETNTGQRRPVPDVYRVLCSNVRGQAGNLRDLTVALFQYDTQLCSETLVQDIRHVSELLVPRFSRCLVVKGHNDSGQSDGGICTRWNGYGAFHQPKFECGCCEMLGFKVCGVGQNFYVFSLYGNTDL